MKENSKSIPKTSSSKVVEKALVLINDDYNTFDHVVDRLTSLCDYDPIQAEQCALLTHYKGSCELMRGEYADLELIKDDLSLYGLNVEIF